MAAVEKLAMHGMNIAALYRETAIGEGAVKQQFANLAKTNDVEILPFNVNALDVSGREGFIKNFTAIVNKKHCVKLLLHSIARGNLKPLVLPDNASESKQELSIEDIKFTTYAMSTSMLDWARVILN